MNILYVSDSDTLSGAEVVMLQYLERLQPPGHCAHVFLRDRNARLQQALRDRGVAFTTTANYSTRLIETTFAPMALVEFARAFASVRRELIELIRAQRIDLIHAISYPASLYAAFAARATGLRQVWHEHNIKRVHRWNRPIYRFVASTCAQVVGPSDAVTRNLRRAGLTDAQVRTVYNGIDLGRFRIDDARAAAVRTQLGLSPGQPAIGLFGQMLPHKGHGTLIEAAARLRGEFPDLRAFLVGALENPPYQEALQARIVQAGLADMFAFTGWRSDVPDVMRAMDINVVATTTPEPAALALMETMAMGRPIVASDTGGTPEIVIDAQTGLLFPPGEADALADRLVRLLGSRADRNRMGMAGRARVEAEFTLERHVHEIAALYERALAGSPSRGPGRTGR